MIEPYDVAVDTALEREDNVEEYLRWKTAGDEFQALLEQCWRKLQGSAITKRLREYR